MSIAPKFPEYAYDATGQDAYATLIDGTAQDCQNISIFCYSNPVILSFDNGVTDHLYVFNGFQYNLDGFGIPKGSIIKAKNANAGSNYSILHLMVW